METRVLRCTHAATRASSVMSHAAMIKLFQKHRNIKYLENGLHRHATRISEIYPLRGDMQKTPS